MEPVLSKCPCEGDYCTDPACDWAKEWEPQACPLTDREREQVAELNDAISRLAMCLDVGDRATAAKIAREVEVEAMSLKLMLSGGKRA